jgi:hypothetical protein
LSTTNVRGFHEGGPPLVVVAVVVVLVVVVVVVDVEPSGDSAVSVADPSADADTAATDPRSMLDPDGRSALVAVLLAPPQPDATAIAIDSTAAGHLVTDPGCLAGVQNAGRGRYPRPAFPCPAPPVSRSRRPGDVVSGGRSLHQ